jgi:hypothetical protein
MIPDAAIELALIANWDTEGDQKERMRAALEAATLPLLAMVRERDAALERVRELHKPEKRWTHPDWTGSFDTREEAAEYDYDEAMGADHKSQVDHFEICAECGRIEGAQLRDVGEVWDYRESLWPCKTAAAITATEGAE